MGERMLWWLGDGVPCQGLGADPKPTEPAPPNFLTAPWYPQHGGVLKKI